MFLCESLFFLDRNKRNCRLIVDLWTYINLSMHVRIKPARIHLIKESFYDNLPSLNISPCLTLILIYYLIVEGDHEHALTLLRVSNIIIFTVCSGMRGCAFHTFAWWIWKQSVRKSREKETKKINGRDDRSYVLYFVKKSLIMFLLHGEPDKRYLCWVSTWEALIISSKYV